MLADCFAVTACCFFWFALAVLFCFCVVCFWTAFGDLSPIIVCFFACKFTCLRNDSFLLRQWHRSLSCPCCKTVSSEFAAVFIHLERFKGVMALCLVSRLPHVAASAAQFGPRAASSSHYEERVGRGQRRGAPRFPIKKRLLSPALSSIRWKRGEPRGLMQP